MVYFYSGELVYFYSAIYKRAFFVFGFAKNERDNISSADLKDFRDAAMLVFNYTDEHIALALENEKLTEVNCDEQDIQK